MLPANQRREVNVFQSRHYKISQAKKGLSISQEDEQLVTCLLHLAMPLLPVEVRTHGTRYAVSIWQEDNVSPGETLPTIG